MQMQKHTEKPSLKRRRVEDGPDGFSKSTSKAGKAMIPSFNPAFEAIERPRKQQDISKSNSSLDPALVKRVATTTAPQKFAQGLDDSRQISSTKPTTTTTFPTAHSILGIKPMVKPSGLSTRLTSAMLEVPHLPFSDNDGMQANSRSTKPTSLSKTRIPLFPSKFDCASPKTPAKPLLKPLVPPRLPTPKAAINQKVLPIPPPPLIPLSSSTTPSKPLRTIATTRVARAIDLSSENGAAELASIVLQNPLEMEVSETTEIKSGLDLSPHKSNSYGRAPKFARNGLAAHAASLLSHASTSLALWTKEFSTLARSPRADLRLRVVKIIHRPSLETHASSNVGLALCRLLHTQSLSSKDIRLGAATDFPLLDTDEDVLSSSLNLVLFEFPSHPISASSPIRNVAEFEQNAELSIWKPWRSITLSPSQVHSLSASTSTSSTGQDSGSGIVASTALFCDRFGCYPSRTRNAID
ncbi:hypothetical protein F5878DRAFT_401107 [Lentinula raphanica]|uniref:Uncharacterized protein n=1 Tax=Lentinula raphanica TaxID=153919 RepID=A0AA38UKY7_9AGAR|nr:hypothetical protein F5878DRAFT_401107 [Lentinula raphanica]